MTMNLLDAAPLVGEYEVIVAESADAADGTINSAKLHNGLVRTAEWTDGAAEHLMNLANYYGAFMLRNALALAVALQIEDGELDF